MSWKLKLDRQREWPAKTMVGEIAFRDPTLHLMEKLPEIEIVRYLPDKSTIYETNWRAVREWLHALVEEEHNAGLLSGLTPAESERAKKAILGFFTSPADEKEPGTLPTTSSSEQASAGTRIE